MENCVLFNFVVWGVCGGALCAFGYLGNLLSVIALQRDIRSATTTLLQSLAVSDLVLLVSVAVTDATPYICDYTKQCVNPWRTWPQVRYVWLLTPVAHMCSIWLVVLVAANRYWAVCRPHAAATTWTTRRTVVYVASVVLGVILFNVPRMFEYRFESFVVDGRSPNVTISARLDWPTSSPSPDYHDDFYLPSDDVQHQSSQHDWNGGRSNDTGEGQVAGEDVKWQWREVATWFGRSAFYRVVYKVLFVNILLVLVPLVTLIVLSVFVIRTLRKTPSYRLSLVHTRPRPATQPPPPPRPISITPSEPVESAELVGCTDDVTAAADDDERRHPQQQQQQQHEQARSGVVNGQLQLDETIESQSVDSDTKCPKRQLKFSISRIKSGRSEHNRKSFGGGGRAGSASREVTFVLVTVVLVAIICQTPLAVFHCVRYVVNAYRCGHVIFYLETAAKLLVNINSCVNFVIYCLLSPKFRRRLVEAVTCRASDARSGRTIGGASSCRVAGVSRYQADAVAAGADISTART